MSGVMKKQSILQLHRAMSFAVVASAVFLSHADTNAVSFDAGADLRIRQEIMKNVPGTPGGGVLSPVARNKSKNHMRFRARVWGELSLGEHFRLFSRFTDEPRWNVTPQNTRACTFPDEVILDNLYLEGLALFDGALDFRFGRQDMWEKGRNLYGLDHVFMDGTPGDGSRTVYTDMARATWHVTEESQLDGFVLYDSDRNKLRWGTGRARNRSLNGLGGNDPEMDEFGAGLVWGSNMGGPDAVPYQLFTVFKKEYSYHRKGVKHPGKDLTAIGARIRPRVSEDLSFDFEGISEVGETSDGRFCNAWSGFAGVDYHPHVDWGFSPRAKLSFHYMSGDKNAAREDGGHGAWDPLWGRGVNDSELFLYGTHYGAAWWSNMSYLKATLMADFGRYHSLSLCTGPMFAAEEDGLGHADRGGGDFKGLLSQARYGFPLLVAPKNASGMKRFEIFGHLLAEFFNPGDYYDSRRPSWFVRWQIDFKF